MNLSFINLDFGFILNQIFSKLNNGFYSKNMDLNKMDIEALGFQGGGVKGLAYIGALRKLEIYGMRLNRIKRFSGTSSGSQIAALIAVGYTVDELETIFYSMPFHKSNNTTSFGILRNIHRLIWSYGFYKGKFITKLIDTLITDKTGHTKTTFNELFEKRGVVLRITGTCLSTRELAYFDYKVSPHMPICKAVQISSCVPLLYAAVKYEGKYYVDGAILRNLPIKSFPENKTLFLKFKETEIDKLNNHHNIGNILKFIYSIIDTTSKFCNDLSITEALHTLQDNIRIIEIDTYIVKVSEFAINYKTKMFLIKQGEHAVTEYIQNVWRLKIIQENRLRELIYVKKLEYTSKEMERLERQHSDLKSKNIELQQSCRIVDW